jgi:MFS family permease
VANPSAGAPVAATPLEERRPIFAVLLATFFVRFAFGLTLSILAEYVSGHGSSSLTASDYGVVGLVSALAPVGEFSTVLISGGLADRYGRWPVLLGGMGTAAALFGVVALTRNVWILGGANFFFGVASGAILAASLAVVGDRAGADVRGYEMGRFDAVNLFGWVAGFALGFGIEPHLPNRELGLLFAAGAGVLTLGLLFAWQIVRHFPVYHGTEGFSFRRVLGVAFRRSVLLVTLPWLVIYALIGTALVFLGSAAGGIGVSSTVLAVVIGGGGAVLVVTQPYYGRLADRFGRNRMLTTGAAGFVSAMVLASLLTRYGAQPEILGALGISVVVALAYGPAALAALADLSRMVSRATTMAIYSLTISLGMTIGLVSSTELFSHLGNTGLYIFFGAIAGSLTILTVARLVDPETRTPPGATTPAR